MTQAKETVGAESNVGTYEIMIILNPDLRESEMKKKLKELTEMFEKGDGKITQDDFWGKRFLAYPIKGKKEGIYNIYNVKFPASAIKEMREALRIDKEVIRSMIIRLPEGHVYTKFDLTIQEKSRDEHKKKDNYTQKKSMNPAVSAKYTGSTKSAHKTKDETSTKIKETSSADLNKKLDDILGGSDLKL